MKKLQISVFFLLSVASSQLSRAQADSQERFRNNPQPIILEMLELVEKERLRKLEPCCCKVEGLEGPARPTTTGHCESIDYKGLDAPLKGRCETNLNVTRVDCPDKDKRIFRFCKGDKGGGFADKWLPDVLDVANACLFTPPDTSSSSSSSSNAVTSSSSSSPAVPRSGSSSNSSRSSSSSSSGLSR